MSTSNATAANEIPFDRSFVTHFHSLDNMHDTDGRPLGEGHASAKALEGVELETTACPFPGSRKGLPMNVSTLVQLKDSWDVVMGSMSEVNRGYLKHQGVSETRGWIDALGCTVACVSLPAYLYGQKQKPIKDGELPVIAAALYKVAIGALRVLNSIILKHIHDPENELIAKVDAEAIVTFAENNGQLVGSELACSGAFWRIIEAMTCIVSPKDESHCEITFDMLPDTDGFFKVATNATAQLVYAQIFELLDKLGEIEFLSGFVSRESGIDPVPGDIGEIARSHWAGLQRVHTAEELRTALGRLLNMADSSNLINTIPIRSYLERSEKEQSDALGDLIYSSSARAEMRRETIDWWSSEITCYAKFRAFYQSEQERLEKEIAEVLGRTPPTLKSSDSTLFPRLHAHAWLESIAGLRIVLSQDEVVAQFKDETITVPL